MSHTRSISKSALGPQRSGSRFLVCLLVPEGAAPVASQDATERSTGELFSNSSTPPCRCIFDVRPVREFV